MREGQRSATRPNGYDRAFFLSPDKQVEFYVFCLQGMGETRETELNPATEIRLNKEEDRDQKKDKSFHWFTFRAKDQSYYRSFVEEIGNNTRTVFGFKYKDMNAKNKYRNDYLTFKKSLRRF